jgi:hypothetical protein
VDNTPTAVSSFWFDAGVSGVVGLTAATSPSPWTHTDALSCTSANRGSARRASSIDRIAGGAHTGPGARIVGSAAAQAGSAVDGPTGATLVVLPVEVGIGGDGTAEAPVRDVADATGAPGTDPATAAPGPTDADEVSSPAQPVVRLNASRTAALETTAARLVTGIGPGNRRGGCPPRPGTGQRTSYHS